MKLAVCDDDVHILSAVEMRLSKKSYAGQLEVSLFSGAEELLAACRRVRFDMIFMDIMLDGDNGIEVAGKAAAIIPGVRVVFITAHVLDFAEEIFARSRLLPYGYIGKPFDSAKMDLYINRALSELEAGERVLCVSRKGVDYRLLLSGIRYIESSGRKAIVHYGDELMVIYKQLNNLSEQLDERFVRCHQSFIVNLEYVSEMQTDCFVVKARTDGKDADGLSIRISRNHVKEARQKYFEYMGRKMI